MTNYLSILSSYIYYKILMYKNFNNEVVTFIETIIPYTFENEFYTLFESLYDVLNRRYRLK